MTYAEQAARELVGPNVRAAGGPPWDSIVQLIADLVADLIAGCAPTPAEGHAFLTERWGPLWRLLGWDGLRNERRIRLAVRRAYDGPREASAVADDVVEALEGGKLNVALMRGLYGEVM